MLRGGFIISEYVFDSFAGLYGNPAGGNTMSEREYLKYGLITGFRILISDFGLIG